MLRKKEDIVLPGKSEEVPKEVVRPGDRPDEVVIDFSGVRPFEPMDSSRQFLCTVTKLENGKGPSGPKSHLEMTIQSPEEVPVEEWIPDESAEGGMVKVGMKEENGQPVMTKAKGRILFRELSLLPQALPFLHEFLMAVGVPKEKLDENFKYFPKEYWGLPLCVKIQNEAFEEQIRPRVKRMQLASAYKE